ncbi:MAG: MurR/RpiR family transcriptional regulator [Candidatus Bipolaricaulota bacterium]|nr:MAG: MurR/RpiR family transcriptional regulator [Candidatus Bipolaricaulota bacterium]
MANLRDRVQEHFAVLTRVQKNLIQSILTDYEEYIFLSVDEAARRLDVHKSTLVRLAQSLEYEGYTDLRADLQDLYRQEITPGEKLGKTLAEVQPDNLYQQVVETEMLYLKESLKTVLNEDIHRAAEMITHARRIFICGRGPQGPLAELFAFRLQRFRLDVIAIPEEGRAILEKLQLLTEEDVLVLFSFLVVPQEHKSAITIAQDVGCPTVLITDSVAKEMLDHVTVTLAARRGPATIYHTNIVPLAIMTAIVLDVAKLLAPEALSTLKRLQDLRRRFGFEYRVVHHEDESDDSDLSDAG